MARRMAPEVIEAMAATIQDASPKHSDHNSPHVLVTSTTATEDAPSTLVEEPSAEEPAVEEPPAKSKAKLCGVCDKEEGKYKCPRCSLPYCSVVCFRTHKDNHPPDPPNPPKSEPKETQGLINNKTPRKRPAHPFSVLDESPELAWLFKKYPNLPSKLASIHAATLPPKDHQQNQPQPLGSGGLPWTLAQAPGYQDPKNNHNKKPKWTHDTGLRRGKDALRKARTDPGEDGDAVREYCELVLHLLSKEKDAEVNVTELLRQQATQEDVKLIEKLVEMEGK